MARLITDDTIAEEATERRIQRGEFSAHRHIQRRIAAMRKVCTVTATPIAGGYRVLAQHRRERDRTCECDLPSSLPLAAFLTSPEYLASERDLLALIDPEMD